MSNDHDVTGEPSATPPSAVASGRVPTGRLRAVVAPAVERSATRSRHRLPSSEEGAAIFELLVAVMWSGGELVAQDVERGRAAAEVMELRPSRGGAFGAIAAGPLPFGEIGFDALSPRARRLAYAAAEWLADASPDPSGRRSGFVRAIQLRLGIDDDDARWLAELALGVGREQVSSRRGFRQLLQAVLRDEA